MTWLAYSVMCLIFGTTFFAIKVGDTTGLPPFWFAAIRFSIAGVLTLCFLYTRGTRFPKNWRIYGRMAVVGFCSTFSTFATLFWAEQYLGSGYAALLSAMGPFMVLGIEWLLRQRQLRAVHVLGTSIGFLGVILIVFPELSNRGQHVLMSTIVVVIGEVFYSLGTIWSRKLMDTYSDTFVVNGVQMLAGGLMLGILASVTERFPSDKLVHTNGLLALLYLIFFGSILANGLFYWLVKHKGTMFPSTWLYVSPVIAVFVGNLVGNESISPWTMIGIPCVLVGVFFIEGYNLRGKRRRKMTVPPAPDVPANQT